MYPFEYHGRPLTHQYIKPGDTATGLSAYCYKYKLYVLNVDAGTDEMKVGDWIIGATSGAIAKVAKIDITSGTWATDNVAAVMLIDSWNGTAWTNNEKIKDAADATCGDVDQAAAIVEATDAQYDSVYRLMFKDKLAQTARVQVYNATSTKGILYCIDGSTPDQTSDIGHNLMGFSETWLHDTDEIINFKCLDYTTADATLVNVTFYF